MIDVRYQVFISSTFIDLESERQAVLYAVLQAGHFPAGMELFPASDQESWKLVTNAIDDSDYYIVIVGGRYGSRDRSGVSYTEREYDYARSLEIPIIPFLRAPTIPSATSEPNVALKRLARFRKRLEKEHTCAYWSDANDLRWRVGHSLNKQMNLNPRTGWVRADYAAGLATLAMSTKSIVRAEPKTIAKADDRAERLPIRQSAIPSGFDVAAAKDVLRGNADRVISFAVWSHTPQGQEYWSDQRKRLASGKSLTPDARDAITQWLQDAQRAAS